MLSLFIAAAIFCESACLVPCSSTEGYFFSMVFSKRIADATIMAHIATIIVMFIMLSFLL